MEYKELTKGGHMNLKDCRWQVEFIFGTITYRLINLSNNTAKELPLEEPVTEDNFRNVFEDICTAAIHVGYAHPGDKRLCTTYPLGAQRVDVKGHA
jgi:hypothetical protein